MAVIELNNMSFYAYHGCFSEEKKIGTHFRVDFEFEIDSIKAEGTDDINDTISYLDVYQSIKKEFQTSSNLLENIARRILNRIESDYPSIRNSKIKVTKLNPPLGGKLEGVSVCLKSS